MLYRNRTAPLDLVENFNSVEAVYDKHEGMVSFFDEPNAFAILL